ncbi:MAG: DUF1963 domain-containing protein [Bacteroidaceae bacterium]|nr:DUF1963 domain-containing protein [Bacteroidaceae bacterium]
MIRIETHPTDSPLTGQSKWWEEPDMPETLDWPSVKVTDEDGETYDDPLTVICQIRCEDICPMDSDNLLPHEGILYFFAALDYFLGDIETPTYPGMDEWQRDYFRVLYSPTCDDLHTHHVNFPDGTPATMPAEAITFSKGDASDDGLKLLGNPYIEEVTSSDSVEKQFTSDMLYKVILSDGKLDRDEDYTYWDVIDECGLPTPTSR